MSAICSPGMSDHASGLTGITCLNDKPSIAIMRLMAPA